MTLVQGAVKSVELAGTGFAGNLPSSPEVWQQLSTVASLDLGGNKLKVRRRESRGGPLS